MKSVWTSARPWLKAIIEALIIRLGKVPGCHGDYCNTLTAKELLELREDHQGAVMEAKRYKAGGLLTHSSAFLAQLSHR